MNSHGHEIERNYHPHHREQEGSSSSDVTHIDSHNVQDGNNNDNSVVPFPLYKFLVLMRCIAFNEDETPPLSVVRMVKSADATVLDELDKIIRERQDYSSHGHKMDNSINNSNSSVNISNDNNNVSDGSQRGSLQR